MKDLFIGDLHVQVSNIQETKILLQHIKDLFISNDCRSLIFLGDLFHTHAVVRQEVAYLLRDFFRDMYYNAVSADKGRLIVIAGNHDGISPTITSQNAVDLTLGEWCTVISGESYHVSDSGYVFVPFIHDDNRFIEVAISGYHTAVQRRGIHTPVLVCHQTFDGASYSNGFPCPEGTKSELLPYSVVIAGHIHKRQSIGDKVMYLGTPRPVTASEINEEKFVYLVDRDPSGMIVFTPVSTKNIVKHYYMLEIGEDAWPEGGTVDLSSFDLKKDDVRVRITGSEKFYDAIKTTLEPYKGQVKLIPNIKKSLSKQISLESSNQSIEVALKNYVLDLESCDSDMKEAVWTEISKMLA